MRSKHENALPIIVTHGWPGSIIEQLKIIEPLTNPTAHGGSAADAFHLVIPSLPGYGFSGKPTATGWDPDSHRPRLDRADAAPRLHALRGAGRRLGECRHRADGAAGAAGIARHPHQHAGHRPRRRSRRRSQFGDAAAGRPVGRRAGTRGISSTSSTSTGWATPRRWATARRRSTGSRIRRSASPPGCSTTTRAATTLIARVFDGQPEGLTRDDILDNVTLYWLTNTAVSSARLYWESKLAFFAPKGVTIPVGVSVFPDEIYPAPRSWAEQAYPKLIHYNRLPKGGHFAAWEQPQALSEELRATFRSLR